MSSSARRSWSLKEVALLTTSQYYTTCLVGKGSWLKRIISILNKEQKA